MSDYVTVRHHLGWLIGRRIADVTQQDEDEFRDAGEFYVMLMLDDGSTLKFPVGEKGITAERPT